MIESSYEFALSPSFNDFEMTENSNLKNSSQATIKHSEKNTLRSIEAFLNKIVSVAALCGVLVWVAFNFQYNIMGAMELAEMPVSGDTLAETAVSWPTSFAILLCLCGIPGILVVYWLGKALRT